LRLPGLGHDDNLGPMSDTYEKLLEATIQHLQSLKTSGIRFVNVSNQTLAALSAMPRMSDVKAPQSSLVPAPKVVVKPVPPLRVTPPEAKPKRNVPEQTLPLALPGEAPAGLAAASLSPEAKAAAFSELRQRVLPCVKCAHLAATRKNVVFGIGNIEAELMFVGEAPGADEDEQGEPFVGRAGELLTRIIQTMGLARDKVYIANILKCRPDTPGQGTGNRKPTPEEMRTCIPYLHEQIDLIRPKVLVALGGTAVEGLLGKTSGITKLRGHWQTYRGTPLMPTYHPAYLLRNQAASEKRRVWEDMLQVMEKLGMPINARQRNYFLKG